MAWTQRERELREAGIPLRSDASIAAGALSGAVAGISAGAFAGPSGAMVGAFIGGAVGVVAGRAIEVHTAQEDATQEELDQQIGIIGGDLGAADIPASAPGYVVFPEDTDENVPSTVRLPPTRSRK
ncbi:hypothetical protein [Pendulispora albinea]|uniref:Complement resistance protein TraT n=1 Tax=Pendulispora albinea TaxID=2741071 RepID=A0ABZ2LV61_9BACT